jgi:hypothetical protein
MTDIDSADLTSDYIDELREEIAALTARAELAEKQRDYWIEQAALHGHGPSGDELPFGEEVADDEPQP